MKNTRSSLLIWRDLKHWRYGVSFMYLSHCSFLNSKEPFQQTFTYLFLSTVYWYLTSSDSLKQTNLALADQSKLLYKLVSRHWAFWKVRYFKGKIRNPLTFEVPPQIFIQFWELYSSKMSCIQIRTALCATSVQFYCMFGTQVVQTVTIGKEMKQSLDSEPVGYN